MVEVARGGDLQVEPSHPDLLVAMNLFDELGGSAVEPVAVILGDSSESAGPFVEFVLGLTATQDDGGRANDVSGVSTEVLARVV